MSAAKHEASKPASVQASALVVAALTWLGVSFQGAFQGANAPAWVLLAYVGAWLLFHKSALRFTRATLMLLCALSAAGAFFGADRLVDSETWGGTAAHLQDRERLQRLPAIAPPIVFGDHPQTFYVSFDSERDSEHDVRIRLGPRGATLDTTSLGHGLHRVDYDPRRHGQVAMADGPVDAQIILGGAGETISRTLHYVAPLAHPRTLCTSPDRTLAASPSLESDELFLVDAEGRVRAVDVGDGPSDCVFLDDQRIAVAHRFGPTLWIVGAGGQILRRIESPFARRLAFSDTLLAVAHADSVALRDASSFALVATLEESDVDWLTFTTPDTLILARRRSAELQRWRRSPIADSIADSTDEWTCDASLPLGRPAVAMVRLDDTHVVVSATDYVPSGEPHMGNHFVQDQLLTIDTDIMRVVEQEITARRSPRQSNAGDVDRGLSPMGLHADRGVLHVAFAGSDEAWVLQPGALPDMRFTDDIPAPEGITRLGRNLVITSPSAGLIATQRDGEWHVVTVGDQDDEAGEDSPRRRGQRAFYEGTRAGVSCQSCHLHGDTDFVLRNIGGQRLAPTLGVGGIADTAPFLRDGSYPRIRDLQHLATTLFRGYLRHDPRRGVDIEAYIRALPRRPVRADIEPGSERDAGRDVERERRGLDIFVQAECTTCHSFPAFTNLAQLPAGVLFPEHGLPDSGDEVLDTPTLLSVSTHAPYLSDGRAEDLTSIFRDHNPRNHHGNTRALSDAELADLVYFLEGL